MLCICFGSNVVKLIYLVLYGVLDFVRGVVGCTDLFVDVSVGNGGVIGDVVDVDVCVIGLVMCCFRRTTDRPTFI